MRGVKKENLPEKVCATCSRLFVWRKKWARDWASVKYCSDACRTGSPRNNGVAASRSGAGN